MTRRISRLPFFIESDGKQAEWVVVAYEAAEKNMMEVVRKRLDPHTMTAASMWGIPPEVILAENKALGKLTSSEELVQGRARLAKQYPELDSAELPRGSTLRQGGKKDNHAGNYREGPHRYAEINGVTIREASLRLFRYSNVVYPGLASEWWPGIEYQVRRFHYMTCPLGCKLPILGPTQGAGADHTFKQATAAVPQHAVHHVVQQAQPKIHAMAPNVKIVSDNHDSNLTQHWIDPREGKEACAAKIFREATAIAEAMTVPLLGKNGEEYVVEIESKAGINWGEAGGSNRWGLIDLPATEEGALSVTEHLFAYMEANL